MGARVITDSRFLPQGDRHRSLRDRYALGKRLGVNLLLGKVWITISLITLAGFVKGIAILRGYLRHPRRGSGLCTSLRFGRSSTTALALAFRASASRPSP